MLGHENVGNDQGIGPDRAIDTVEVDAEAANHGPAAKKAKKQAEKNAADVKQAAPEADPEADEFAPGDAPSQVLRWAVESLAEAGTLSIIGVYPQTQQTFPIGRAMMKNLAINMGNCHYRRYIPRLVERADSEKVGI